MLRFVPAPEQLNDLRFPGIPDRAVLPSDTAREIAHAAIADAPSAAEIYGAMAFSDAESRYHGVRFGGTGTFIGLVSRKQPYGCSHGIFIPPGPEGEIDSFSVTDRKQYQWNFESPGIPYRRSRGAVIDMSCGRGSRILELRRDGVIAFGVDPLIIEGALPDAHAGVLRTGIAQRLPFGDGEAARLESYYGYFMVEKNPDGILLGLREASRVLEPGGLLVIVPPSRYLHDNAELLVSKVAGLAILGEPGWRIVLQKDG